jgi:hypothetical protein
VMCYEGLFYPAYTVGHDQLYKVLEAAVSHKCEQLQAPNSLKRYSDKINWLYDREVLTGKLPERWQSARAVRNMTSHVKRRRIISPDMAHSLETVKLGVVMCPRRALDLRLAIPAHVSKTHTFRIGFSIHTYQTGHLARAAQITLHISPFWAAYLRRLGRVFLGIPATEAMGFTSSPSSFSRLVSSSRHMASDK